MLLIGHHENSSFCARNLQSRWVATATSQMTVGSAFFQLKLMMLSVVLDPLLRQVLYFVYCVSALRIVPNASHVCTTDSGSVCILMHLTDGLG